MNDGPRVARDRGSQRLLERADEGAAAGRHDGRFYLVAEYDLRPALRQVLRQPVA